MGVRLGVKKSRTPLVQQPWFFAVLLVFSCIPLTCKGGDGVDWQIYETEQLTALQALWGAWNQSTPDLEINLAGWNSSQPYPCGQGGDAGEQPPNWRGVQCISYNHCYSSDNPIGLSCDTNTTTLIVGLILKDASIIGTLPEVMENIETLTTLELTGNPNLTGPVPFDQLPLDYFLFNLDLHDNGFDNGFDGALDFSSNAWQVTQLDLSGNQFNGPFPWSNSLDDSSALLQTLNLGRNGFEGGIPANAFDYMTQLVHLDLSSNRFNGTLPTLSTMKNLQTLNLSLNTFTGSIFSSSASNFSLAKNNGLSVLDLSHNQFTSALDSWNISELGSLQELYLDNNSIQGTLNITRLALLGLLGTKSSESTAPSGKLRVLSLKNNSITNVVYDASIIEDITTVISLQGNPYRDSNDGTSTFSRQVCSITSVPKQNDKTKVVITAVVPSVISVLLMIGLGATLYRQRRYRRYLQLQFQQKFEEFEVKPTIYPYNQLRTATRDFHPEMKLGQGAFGAVFKGVLPNGHVVAVKQLFAKTSQGIDEFLNEVVLLTGMKHRNLVNLKGCCIREQQRLLVYEYVDNYDMDQILLVGPNKTILSWPVLLKLCLGVARGLHYLHALAFPRIVHRDIKASNILLTKNYESKIADFGLAALFPDEESYIMTQHVAGTKGYLAPEYASYGQLSDKVDIFSFGVLCLEVVSGRRNINVKLAPDEVYLPNRAWELHRQGRLMDLVDPAMSVQDEEKLEVERLITISLLCIQLSAHQRPSMERVVAMLQGESDSEAVVLNPGNEEQGLNSMRLFAFAEGGLDTVTEGESSDMESSLMDSSRRAAGLSEEGVSSYATSVELSEIRSFT